MSTFQKKLQIDRNNEETSNAGLKWDKDDDNYLTENAKNGMSIDELAKNLKRTEGSIKTRLVINVIQSLNGDRSNLNELCSEYKIEKIDIENYESKKKLREDRRNRRSTYDKNDKGMNNTNYSSFPNKDILEILEGLSILDRKMNTMLEKQADIFKYINSK